MQGDQFGCSPQRREPIKQRLDSLLENDYAALRKGDINADDLLLKNHNYLVLEYVKSIYNEYHIQDPLPENVDLSRISFTPSGKKTSKKKKIHLMSTQTVKQSTPVRLKSSSNIRGLNDFDLVGDESTVRKEYFQNNTTIRASMSYFDVSSDRRDPQLSLGNTTVLQRESESEFQRSSIKERAGLEIIIQDEVRPISEDVQSSRIVPIIKLPGEAEQLDQYKEHIFLLPPMPAIEKIAQSSRRGKQPSGYVDESFRYCIGCEQALLHANITIHETNCRQFQQVFQMSPLEIVNYLKKKMGQFEQRIKKQSNQLLKVDVEKLQQCSLKMIEGGMVVSGCGIITDQFERDYVKVIQIGKRWCLMTEQINKVNWFLKIRERIKQEFQL